MLRGALSFPVGCFVPADTTSLYQTGRPYHAVLASRHESIKMVAVRREALPPCPEL